MTCLLCLDGEVNEHPIDISSEYGQQLNVASIVHMHFGICFHVSSDESRLETNRVKSNHLKFSSDCRNNHEKVRCVKSAG